MLARGLEEPHVHELLGAARAKTAEFGGAVLKVAANGAGVSAKVHPRNAVSLPVPKLDEHRLQIPA